MFYRLFVFLFLSISPAFAQWQVPTNTIPYGRGPGIQGFGVITNNGSGTLCLVNTQPPTFQTCPTAGGNQWTTSGTDIINNNAGTVKISNLTTTGLVGFLLGNGSAPVTAIGASGTGSVARVASPALTGTVTYNGIPLAASATTDTTSASNINSGTLPDARLSNTITAGGPTGDSTHTPVITFDAHGRLTAVTTAAISALQPANNLSDLANAATARTNLGLGSMATQAASAVAITGGTVTGMSNPTVASDVANKSYVDSIAAGLSIKQAVKYGTVTALASNTYANGASGVGATLTENTNGAISFDGLSPTAGDRVLVKNEATAANNGCYTVTAVGTGAAPYVLTRCTDLDTAAELVAGSAMLITNGSTLANTGWALQSTVTTVGTTAANFAQYAGGSQWANTGNDIYFSGKVAVGSAVAPVFDLDVVRSVNGSLTGRVYNANSGSSAFADLTLGTDTSSTIGQFLAMSSTNTAYAGVNSVNVINGTNNPLGFGTNNTIRAIIDGPGNLRLTHYGAGTLTADSSGNIKASTAHYGTAYGMICDGSTANDTAWGLLTTAYAAAPGPIILPPGKCNFTGAAAITVSSASGLSITGGGANSSILVFTGATNGLVIDYTSSGRWFNGTLTLQDFGVQTTQTDAGDGIQINGGAIGASPGAPTFIKNVHVYSDTSPHRWVTGLKLTTVSRVVINGFFYDGDNNSFDHGVGIKITSPSVEAVEYMFNEVEINYASIGMYITGHIQGVTVINSNITAVTTGVAWDTAILEPQFTMSSSQISATDRAMVFNNLAQSVISGNLFYAIGSPSLATIYATNMVDVTISNNTFEPSVDVNGIVFGSGSSNNVITGNIMRGSGTGAGVWLQAGATGNVIGQNQINGFASSTLDSGSGNNADLGTSAIPAGNVYAQGYRSRSGIGGSFGGNSFNLFWTGTNTHLYIDNSDQGAISMVSDIRFKNLLPDAPSGEAILSKITSLDFFRFRFKTLGVMHDDGIERDGFSAEQLQRLFPATVNGSPDAIDDKGIPIAQTINQPELWPVALIAIKELTKRNDRLSARVSQLEKTAKPRRTRN